MAESDATNITVSVVMPVYNALPYLTEAMDSILSQVGVTLEFVVVDDGSTDGSLDVLQSYAEKDTRVKLVTQPHQGLTHALIKGCRVATGVYIARQDSDDRSMPLRLAKQVYFLSQHPQAVAVGTWVRHTGPEGESLYTTQYAKSLKLATAEVSQRIRGPAHGSIMIRRAIFQKIGGYRPQFRYVQDWDLWYRIVEVGFFGYVPEILYEFRHQVNSTGSQKAHLKRQFGELADDARAARERCGSDLAVLDTFTENLLSEHDDENSIQRRKAATLYQVGRQLFRNGDRRACKYLWQSQAIDPSNARGWVLWFFALVGLCPWWRRKKVL